MRKLSFEEFIDEVMNDVRTWLPEEYQDAKVSLHEKYKNNGGYKIALIIQKDFENNAPCIYLEKYWDEYMEGREMDDIMREIADIRVECGLNRNLNTRFIDDLDSCMNRIMPILVGTEQNVSMLNYRPHIIIADLAVTFCLDASPEGNMTMRIAVTNDMADKWGVSAEELYQIAVNNLESANIGELKTMNEVLGTPKTGADSTIYILSTRYQINGAIILLDRNMMQQAINTVGTDFFILPSSIHEVLLLPTKCGMPKEYLEAMVQEVNETEVSQEERLSNHIYRYTLDEGIARL